MNRQPAVAGMFYEGQASALRDHIQSLWPGEPGPVLDGPGAVIPHAGYIYSGRTAARVYAQLAPADVYILLGPNHTGRGSALAVTQSEIWNTPLGDVLVDQAVADAIALAMPEVKRDETAHGREHCLEVQLPFLQVQQHAFSIVPMVIGTQRFELLEKLGQVLGKVCEDCGKKCRIIASSDMNHFEDEARTRFLDNLALEQVLNLDAQGLMETVKRNRISMCGAGPTAAMLVAAKTQGATRAELIDYTTSAEFSGDRDRVVGYAGVIVC